MKKSGYKILVVDDDVSIREMLQYNLEKEGYQVSTASDGIHAIEEAQRFLPDLVLLDIMMPGQDGVETCRQLKTFAELKNTYVMMLTARSEEFTEVSAFNVGADDFIVKPIKPRALHSRIEAVIRRRVSRQALPNALQIKNLKIDRDKYVVTLNDNELNFPRKEFELLFFLAQSPNKVFERDEILNTIWGADVYVLARTVDVHVRKIREKIGDHFISTVKGVGYKFNAD